MICEKCGKNPATVHLTNLDQGQKKEWHLCGECAREGSNVIWFHSPFMPISFKDLLSQMATGKKVQAACSKCGTTMEQFRQNGRLGCASCYKDLRNELIPVLRSVQGKLQHTGSRPAASKTQTDLEELRKELQQAVLTEEYEKAAKIRDRIRQLESRQECAKESD
jgi:protein arginine kinase activator